MFGKGDELVEDILDKNAKYDGPLVQGAKYNEEFLVNIKSSDVTTVFASFFNILMITLEGDKFTLFKSYLSYLIFEVQNYVGSLIFTYNYIYSLDYLTTNTIYKNILLQNFLSIG